MPRREPSGQRRFTANTTENRMATLDPDRLGEVRTDWSLEEARALFELPFSDLLFHTA